MKVGFAGFDFLNHQTVRPDGIQNKNIKKKAEIRLNVIDYGSVYC